MLNNLRKFLTRIKNILRHLLIRFGLHVFELSAPLWVRILKISAQTGRGTDLCLEHGFLPMQVHYYSPVPHLGDLKSRQVWNQKSELEGIVFRPDEQVNTLLLLGKEYGIECNWPAMPSDHETSFYTENGSFSFGCAASLHCMIRYFKPRHLIEVGSGKSSLVFSQSINQNKVDGFDSEYFIIDPYPCALIEKGIPGVSKLFKTRVELVERSFFDKLEENDILFVDSGHVVRTGGDVNYLILDILPRLKPGVIVHFHDIPMPFEYPESYFSNSAFRVFWTESYLLQAFLSCNSQFEVLLAMNYLMGQKMNEFQKAFPRYDPNKHSAGSGSFWIRRKPE